MARITELEKQLGKNSSNSSKPPSTDGFKKKIQNNREKTERKPGGQEGHEGTTLKMAPPEEVSQTIYLPVEAQCECGEDLSVNGKVLDPERRQVWDIPKLTPWIEEYHLERKQCSCGRVHKAKSTIPYSIQYGPRIRAACCYLQQVQLLPVGRTQELLADLFGFKQLSEGIILDSSARCYEELETWEREQKDLLVKAEVLHTDETGISVCGKREWGHVCSTDTLTLYQHHPNRGRKAHEAHGILPIFKGLLMHDRYSSYQGYECEHSLCNAHLMRELKGLIEDSQQWAIGMYALLNEAYQGWHCADSLEIAYQRILKQGFNDNPLPEKSERRGKTKKTASLNLLECFRDHKKEIFRFFHEKKAPFDNNQAERDLRMFKLQQKISGCFRTEKGAKIFCRVRSYVSTLRKQGKNVWQELSFIFENAAYGMG